MERLKGVVVTCDVRDGSEPSLKPRRYSSLEAAEAYADGYSDSADAHGCYCDVRALALGTERGFSEWECAGFPGIGDLQDLIDGGPGG